MKWWIFGKREEKVRGRALGGRVTSIVKEMGIFSGGGGGVCITFVLFGFTPILNSSSCTPFPVISLSSGSTDTSGL